MKSEEIIDKVEKRRLAKIKINRYNILGKESGISKKEYEEALKDASFRIESKGKKSNPFKIPFNEDGSIDFKRIRNGI